MRSDCTITHFLRPDLLSYYEDIKLALRIIFLERISQHQKVITLVRFHRVVSRLLQDQIRSQQES